MIKISYDHDHHDHLRSCLLPFNLKSAIHLNLKSPIVHRIVNRTSLAPFLVFFNFPLLFYFTGQQDADKIEQQKRNSHKHLTHHIGSGRDYAGYNEYDHHRIFPDLAQVGSGYNTDLSQEIHHQRKLKGKSAAQNKGQYHIDIAVDGPDIFYGFVKLEMEEKVQGIGATTK
jgi:hypothetical protein